MPETQIKIAAMLGMEPTADALRLRCRDAENNVYTIDLTAPMVGGLAVALTQQAAQVQGSVGQPMTLNAGRPFSIADGRIGLELTLDNGLRLPVLFPKESLPVLRKTIDELERLSKQSPAAPRQN
jgi:hypothetical protein